MGHKVALRYDEHRGLPSTIFAETRYFVTDVRPVESLYEGERAIPQK